jgi:hypothetical protein
VIGKGCFGKVFLVRECATAKVYAMKVVKKKLIAQQNKLKYIFDTFLGTYFDFLFPAEGSILDGTLRYSKEQKERK